MENELTPRLQLIYPVERKIMDENIEKDGKNSEVVEEDKKEKKAAEAVVVDESKKEKARNRWEEENKRRMARGERITDEDRELQGQMIERGIPPTIGGASEGKVFAEFDVAKYRNTTLYDLANELREAGLKDEITEEKLNDIKQRAYREELSGVSSDLIHQFESDINEAILKSRREKQDNASESYLVREAAAGQEKGKSVELNVENLVGTNLEPLARQISNLTRAGRPPTQQMIDDWQTQATKLVEKGSISPTEYQYFDAFLQDLIQNANLRQEGRGIERGRATTPQSIQEVCLWIIQNEGDEWGPGGPNELLDTLDIEKAKFNKANFLKWVRERMLFYDDFSPDDPNLNLLGSIGFETEYRTIGLGTMINNKKQYFKDRNERDEAGNYKVYDSFAEEIVNEIFLFAMSRNFDAQYRYRMWNDEDLPKFLQELHQKSIFTNQKQLQKIFKFSADYGSNDTKVGDSIRTAYEVYYFMSDYDKLVEKLGADNPFFTRQGFEDAYRLLNELPKDAENPENYRKLLSDPEDGIFDKNGKPVKGRFIDFINIFNETGKNQSTVSLVREALRLAISHKYGLENGLDINPVNDAEKKRRKTRRKNLEYAERWANSMARWTGAGARNDTGAIGYDAQTKAMRFQQYRIRQSLAERGGAFGNQYDLPIIKDLTLDFFNGIFVEKNVGETQNYTPFEIFEKLDEYDRQIMSIRRGRKDEELNEKEEERIQELMEMKNPWYEKLKFKSFTELDYASNHLGRSWALFHRLMGAEEIQIDQIVKFEPLRGLVFDRGKFEEQVKENFIKPIRYAFKTYSNIDYSKTMRVQDLKESKNKGFPVYKDVTVAEAMFGPAVLKDFYKKGTKEIDPEQLRNTTKLYKNVARAILAAHIRSHRERFSGYSHMNREQVNMFYEALESIRSVEIDEDEEKFKEGERFFSEEDIKWMRTYSKTSNGRMILTDVAPRVVGGVIGGGFKGLKDFFEDIFK